MAICIDNAQAPILQDAQITYTPTRFNGSLFHETIYRKEASPEVDLAWRALGVDCRYLNFISGLLIFPSRDWYICPPDYAMVVSVDEAEISGIELDRLKVGEEYGGPGYPVVVEALHQLHCLVKLRSQT